MALTYFYAELFGTIIALIGLALLANRRAMLGTVREVIDSRGMLFILGILSLFLGLLVVLTHNIWDSNVLDVLVTLFGWLMVLRGVLIFFLPHGTIRKFFNAFAFEQTYYAVSIIALLIGLYMAWNGYAVTGF